MKTIQKNQTSKQATVPKKLKICKQSTEVLLLGDQVLGVKLLDRLKC